MHLELERVTKDLDLRTVQHKLCPHPGLAQEFFDVKTMNVTRDITWSVRIPALRPKRTMCPIYFSAVYTSISKPLKSLFNVGRM